MAKESGVEVGGTVVEALSNGFFAVELDQQGAAPEADKVRVIAHIGGKMRTRFIRVVAGDRVLLELSPYDLTRGRITWLQSRRRPVNPGDPEQAAAPAGPPRRGGRR